jgi:hypothetical protein
VRKKKVDLLKIGNQSYPAGGWGHTFITQNSEISKFWRGWFSL